MNAHRAWLAIAIGVLMVAAGTAFYALHEHPAVDQVEEQTIHPMFVTPVGADGSLTNVDVGFPWSEPGYCAGQFHAAAIETETQVRVGDVISSDPSGAACAGLGSNGRWATAGLRLQQPIGHRQVVRESDGAALPVFALAMILRCQDTIASMPAPSANDVVVFDKVALPAMALQAAPSGDSDPSARLFAKAALVVAAGSTFMLRLPEEWMGRAGIGWGSPATRTMAQYVSSCQGRARWLVFAGGLWVAEPSCVPLVVNSWNQERTVMIGVGKACPGQADPSPAA